MENPFEKIEALILEVMEKQNELAARLDKIQKEGDAADELISRFEKAKQLGVSLATLNNWDRNGILKPVRRGRKVFYYKREHHPKAPTIHTR